jgi:CRISPR-associated protein Csb2
VNGVVVIEAELLSGRYHAHVWGEAQFGMAGPEWPPSPWRLLRALASAWFSVRPNPYSEQDRDSLLEALGRAEPPELWLPKTSFHEIRYYQPVRVGTADRVLHHDHYAVPEGGRFWFCCNVTLTDRQRKLLEALLMALRYLGRAESRVRLHLANLDTPPPGVGLATPRWCVGRATDIQYRRVLCPKREDFRASDLWSVRRHSTTNLGDNYPPHLVDTLLHKKMPLPDGACWVEYAVPERLLVHEIPPRRQIRTEEQCVKVAEIRFRLNRRIPIPLQSLIPVARAFRDEAVDRYRRLTGSISPTLSGRDLAGNVARGHLHAYYLPVLSTTRKNVETLRVYIPTGWLTRSELDALLGVTHITVGGSSYPITVVAEETVSNPPEPKPAMRWVSVTPFLPPFRYWRRRGRAAVEEQAAVCAQMACHCRPVVQRPVGANFACISSLLAHQYYGSGSGAGRRPWMFTRRFGFWLELHFEEPVVLPPSLGGDAHFGAGRFDPGTLSEASTFRSRGRPLTL